MRAPNYARAGVDIEAAHGAVERIRDLAAAASRPEVAGSVGGFAGLFRLGPVAGGATLVASADGVGTKLLVAQAAGRYETVGVDLVAMVVDDLVCTGAEPLFLLDYLAVGRLEPDTVAAVVAGVAEGCRQAGCALLGGETAEHPGAMAPGDLDLAGFGVGLVAQGELLGPERVREGDALVALASPGLRSNGYALARHVLLHDAGLALEGPAWAGSERTLADVLLEPSRIYAPAVRAAARACEGALHAAAHVTGGGLGANLARVLPPHLDAVVEHAWEVPRIFEEIGRLGQVPDDELREVFNLGVGMVLVVAPEGRDALEEALVAAGERCFALGEVVAGSGRVRLEGAW